MKKLLIGCGVVVLLMIVLLTGFAIFAGIKVQRYAGEIEAGAKAIAAVETKYAFAPPASGAIDNARLLAALRVRENLWQAVLANPIVKKIADAEKAGVQPDLSASDVLGMAGEVPRIMERAAQEFDAARMSPKEYAWIVNRAYVTIYEEASNGDAEFVAVEEAIVKNLDTLNNAMKGNPQNQVRYRSVLAMLADPKTPNHPDNAKVLRPNLKAFVDVPIYFLELMLLQQGDLNIAIGGVPVAPAAPETPETPEMSEEELAPTGS